MDLGLRNGGGIADSMYIDDYDSNSTNFFARWAFNLIFFIFVNIISLNVIFGIIIDTFAELRAKQMQRDWDQNNKCFVCGLERRVFEKQTKSFVQHVHLEHNPWNYVDYLVYLSSIDPQDHTGFEHSVITRY
jgi:hypothetical protein